MIAGDSVGVVVSNVLSLGSTEKEKKEKASQEGGDVQGGCCDSTPSLKSCEFWAGGRRDSPA